ATSPRVDLSAVERRVSANPRHAELLADDREDEVRMGLGEVEDLLHRLADAAPEQPARPERDLALDGLEPRVARVRPRVEERRQARAAVRLAQRVQEDE